MLQLGPLNRNSDRYVLLRSLYEHAVVFAWLAADPPHRYELFLREDGLRRIKADNDIHAIAGVRLLTPANTKTFSAQASGLPSKQHSWMPKWEALAATADMDWKGKLPHLPEKTLRGPTRLRTYRGLYALAYRRYSSVTHPTLWGLNHVTEPVSGGNERINLEQPDDEAEGDPLAMASLLLAFTLFISAQVLGWPTEAEVDEVFQK